MRQPFRLGTQNSPIRVSLPRFHYRVGLHIDLFEVCTRRFLTLRPAHSRSHQIRDRYPGASDISSPPCLPRLLPAGAFAGWALHPLEKRRLVTAHMEFSLYLSDGVARILERSRPF